MPVTIDSTRFGSLDVPDEEIIEFPQGLIGLGGARYSLLERGDGDPFLWLHSLDDPSLAIPVTRPETFFAAYELQLSAADRERIAVDPDEVEVFVTVSAAESVADFRANLRAPILIAGGRGYQMINELDGLSVRTPLFSDDALVQVA